MRKLGRVCAVILFFAIFQLNSVDAKSIHTKCLNHVDVYVNGQVSIDTQINGVSQDYKQVVVDISEISVEIEENNQKKTYTNFKEQTQQGSKEKEYHKEVDPFSKNAVITVNGRIKSEELNINMTFSKIYSGESLLAAVKECPTQSGCDIRITSEEVKNIITYDVIFKTEDGGKFSDDQEYIEHVNIVSGKQFPNVPELIADENYNFLGWYNEETGLKIEEFPKTVTEDLVAIAKWELVEQKEDVDDGEDDNKDNQDNDNEDNNDTQEDNQNDDSEKNEENKTDENNNCIEETEEQSSETIETVATAVSDDNNVLALENSGLETLDSYNPPKTAVENNIVLLIVSFIICSTVTIGLGYKIRKNSKNV